MDPAVSILWKDMLRDVGELSDMFCVGLEVVHPSIDHERNRRFRQNLGAPKLVPPRRFYMFIKPELPRLKPGGTENHPMVLGPSCLVTPMCSGPGAES